MSKHPLADPDAAGAVVEKRLFDAWGAILKVQNGAGNTLNGLTILDRGYPQIALICNKHPLADSAELHSVPTKLSRQYKSKKSYIYQKRYSFFVFKRISLVVI